MKTDSKCHRYYFGIKYRNTIHQMNSMINTLGYDEKEVLGKSYLNF
jgi:hypothetical protein